jgi:FdhD protein
MDMQTLKHKISRFRDGVFCPVENPLAVEELLEIYVGSSPYAITMRLPGDDVNLVAGFCYTEGIITSRDDLVGIKRCEATADRSRVFVRLKPDLQKTLSGREVREEYVSKSSCGISGKSKSADVFTQLKPVENFHPIHPTTILALKDHFEARQTIFQLTGATHSACLFDLEANLLAFAEDIGRHNALDKVIGSLVLSARTQLAFLAIVSSRLSFEMVQKAAILGIELLCGVSAPTSMAITIADQLNITLIGFLRGTSMSIYTHPERITDS